MTALAIVLLVSEGGLFLLGLAATLTFAPRVASLGLVFAGGSVLSGLALAVWTLS